MNQVSCFMLSHSLFYACSTLRTTHSPVPGYLGCFQLLANSSTASRHLSMQTNAGASTLLQVCAREWSYRIITVMACVILRHLAVFHLISAKLGFLGSLKYASHTLIFFRQSHELPASFPSSCLPENLVPGWVSIPCLLSCLDLEGNVTVVTKAMINQDSCSPGNFSCQGKVQATGEGGKRGAKTYAPVSPVPLISAVECDGIYATGAMGTQHTSTLEWRNDASVHLHLPLTSSL